MSDMAERVNALREVESILKTIDGLTVTTKPVRAANIRTADLPVVALAYAEAQRTAANQQLSTFGQKAELAIILHAADIDAFALETWVTAIVDKIDSIANVQGRAFVLIASKIDIGFDPDGKAPAAAITVTVDIGAQ